MTYFLKAGTSFMVTQKENMDIHEKLPPGNYIIQKSMQGLFLEAIPSFEINHKIYGDTVKTADRILNTFHSRAKSTGVMLSGEKGSGKTLLAKLISVHAAAANKIPTIVINQPWCGDQFNTFLQSIEQPVIVLFDEFEKVYNKEQQEHILTLLDGVVSSQKLFIVTCNDKWRIDSHMRNRPGRIFYMKDFTGLSVEFIREYSTDNLKPSMVHHVEKLCAITTLFGQFNFDMLTAMIEEMNRYEESPEEVLKLLNCKPEYDGGNLYDIELHLDDKKVGVDLLQRRTWHGNPMKPEGDMCVSYKVHRTTGLPSFDEADPKNNSQNHYYWNSAEFEDADLLKIDANTGKFFFRNPENQVMILTKAKPSKIGKWQISY